MHCKATGIYSPGVVTASMFNPPMLLFFWKAFQTGILTWPVLLLSSFMGIAGMPVVIYFTHNIVLKNSTGQ